LANDLFMFERIKKVEQVCHERSLKKNLPSHSCTPMIPKMKNTKKHSRRTLPSIGNVSSSNITKILIPKLEKEKIWK